MTETSVLPFFVSRDSDGGRTETFPMVEVPAFMTVGPGGSEVVVNYS
jgi:hypothetical protein